MTVQRVFMTTDCVGGVWDYSLELARGLSLRGVRTVLAVLGEPSEARRAAAAAVPGLVLESAPYRLEWMEGGCADQPGAGRWLKSLARKYAPDVAHLNTYAHGSLELGMPRLLVAHSCVCSWWRAVKRTDAPHRFSPYAQLVREGIAGAGVVVFPTKAMALAAAELHGIAQRSLVIANGRNPAEYRPLPKQEYVLAAGRLWDEAKNIAAVDAVAPHLEWPVRIAGECSCREDVTAPPRQAEYLGFLEGGEMADALGRAAVFVHPARYEPFGLTVLEAALSGCALVLGDIPTLRELWDGAALFVRPDDREHLRKSLSWLIRNPELRRLMARRARNRSLAYGACRMVNAYVHLYSELAGETAFLGEARP